MPEWFYDHGIGEDRAMLVEDGNIVEARIERHEGIKPGLTIDAKLISRVVGNTRGIVRLSDGGEALLSPLPKDLNEGAAIRVEVTRSAIDEKSRFKLPLVRAAVDKALADAPTLFDQISASGLPVKPYRRHDEVDQFEAHGWSEILEAARTGQVSFDGGTLQIALTPAMTLIDIDGNLPPVALAMNAAHASALAIRRLDIQGNIGIDFPALADKGDRQKVAEAFDAVMHGAFERTAINGFGFMQIVTRRTTQSLVEQMQYRRTLAATLRFLRAAERHSIAGPLQLVCGPAVIAVLQGRPDWLDELSKRTGRTVSLRSDPELALEASYTERAD